MTESKIEVLANKLQLFWFIIDRLSDGDEIAPEIIEKVYKSLPTIKKLLKEIEEDNYGCDNKAVSFGRFLLPNNKNIEKLFEHFNEKI